MLPTPGDTLGAIDAAGYGEVVDVDEVVEAAVARSAALAEGARAAMRDSAPGAALCWDPFDDAWRQDPEPRYSQLLAQNPVHRHPLGFWVLARHEDCLTILRDRRAGTARRARGDLPRPTLLEGMEPFLFRDPPDHTRLRGLVQQAFTPRVVEQMRASVQALADDMVSACLAEGEVDLVADLAYPLPVRVIAELLGVPPEDHDRFSGWSRALARGLDPEILQPAEVVEERVRATAAFVSYFEDLIEKRRRHPTDDLLSRLVAVSADGDTLSPAELLGTCILLLVAGHETTVNLIAGSILALERQPDARSHWREHPEIARRAVDELLRYVSPVQLDARLAHEDIAIGGSRAIGGSTVIEAGSVIVMLLGAANRDPAVFDQPDRLVLDRQPNPHLGFGFGIHHCIGAPLARLEAEVVLTTLFQRGDVTLLEDRPIYKEQMVLRGPVSLPARARPR